SGLMTRKRTRYRGASRTVAWCGRSICAVSAWNRTTILSPVSSSNPSPQSFDVTSSSGTGLLPVTSMCASSALSGREGPFRRSQPAPESVIMSAAAPAEAAGQRERMRERMGTSSLRRCCSALLVGIAACRPPEPVPLVRPGEPLAGLAPAQLGRFRAGEALFNAVFTPEQGLGPFFNENQCSACHTAPATGGTGEQLVVRASRFTPPDRCDSLREAGGENVRAVTTP